MKDNVKISAFLIIVICVYLTQSILSLPILKIFNFRVDVKNIVEGIEMIMFLIFGISFLIWYFRVSKNYDYLNNSQTATKNLLYWFIPFFNAYLVYSHLKIIYQDFGNKLERPLLNDSSSKTKIALFVWLIFFIISYLFSFYVMNEIPMFPEDEEIYYTMNADFDFYHRLGGIIIDIFGVSSIFIIVKNISKLDESLNSRGRNLDISEQLIDE